MGKVYETVEETNKLINNYINQLKDIDINESLTVNGIILMLESIKETLIAQ